MEGINLVIPKTSPMKLEVMVGSSWSGQVSFPCQLGVEYTIDELKAFARMKKPSLEGKNFEVIPTAQRVFRFKFRK